MVNPSENFDIEDLISYGDDLINVLNVKNSFDIFSQSLEHLKALHFTCDEDFNHTQRSIKDCKKKLDACKKKTEEAYSDVSNGDDNESLQRKLEEEMELERKLEDEIRVVADELQDLSAQWISIDEQRQSIKRKERDELRAKKLLSMYASVTKVIPSIDNDSSKISGYMVDREKRVIEKFDFETNTMTAYEACNNVWSIISKH